jgi:hypothetical protein
VTEAEPPAYFEMEEAERIALPAIHHRPVFDGLASPHSWICAVCWGDGWTSGWPCAPATAGGRELGKALGLEVLW